MLPPHTSELLYSGGDWRLPGADDQVCEGARFHSPTPMFVDWTYLVPRQWLTDAGLNPGVAAEAPWLCGTCRDNLAILQQIFFAQDGKVDWKIRREFGNDLRALAERGWETWVSVRPKETQQDG